MSNDRTAQPVHIAYPVGSVWNHRTYGDQRFTVVGHGEGRVIVSYAEGSGTATESWVRQALDAYGTIVEYPATARPTIDFSGSSRATARDYAARAVSRINRPETNEILDAVAQGESVDAYALAEAVLDAMRGATTRCGQSYGRREMAREIAYLGHIVHPVLANHADGLPAYAEGDRSRAVEAAREGLREATAEIDRVVASLNDVTARAERESERRRRAEQEVIDLRAERDALQVERDEVHSVLAYALDRLSPEDRARVFGYWDGITEA